MKANRVLFLLLFWLSPALAQSFYGFTAEGVETHSTVTIKADGSAQIEAQTVEPRAIAEQQILMWEKYEKTQDADSDDDNKPDATANQPATAPKPLTDDELSAKLRESMQNRGRWMKLATAAIAAL